MNLVAPEGAVRVLKTAVTTVVALLLMTSGCMTERVQPVMEAPSAPKQTTFLVKKIMYDDHGRPIFLDRITLRPGKRGDRFTIVFAKNNKPVRSYDIAIIEQPKADMSKPFAVIYQWTGKGFEAGLNVSGRMLQGNVAINSRDEALAYLAIASAPIVIGGVAGFVVGVASSVPVTANELKRVIVNSREMLIGYAVYGYDERDRIKYLMAYPPEEHAKEIIRTEYFYSGESRDPYQTEVTSPPERKRRIL
jgi:hypothetical protein